MPKRVPCPGSGHIVFGPDEPNGTVFCTVCGNPMLPMNKTTLADGKIQYSVSDHYRTVIKLRRPKGAPSNRSRPRNSGRRR